MLEFAEPLEPAYCSDVSVRHVGPGIDRPLVDDQARRAQVYCRTTVGHSTTTGRFDVRLCERRPETAARTTFERSYFDRRRHGNGMAQRPIQRPASGARAEVAEECHGYG